MEQKLKSNDTLPSRSFILIIFVFSITFLLIVFVDRFLRIMVDKMNVLKFYLQQAPFIYKWSFITFCIWIRIHSLAKNCQELSKEFSVQVARHLVENKPVPNRAVHDVMLNMGNILIGLEVSVHLYSHEVESEHTHACLARTTQYEDIPDSSRADLDQPVDYPVGGDDQK